MPATYVTDHLRSRAEFRAVDYDIDDALNIVDLGQPQGVGTNCLQVLPFRRFLAGLFRSVGAGTVTAFQIIAATDAAGSNATVVVEHALGEAPDATGDVIWLECDAEQIHEVLATATHVGVRVQLETAGDEAVIIFARAEPMFAHAGTATADFIS